MQASRSVDAILYAGRSPVIRGIEAQINDHDRPKHVASTFSKHTSDMNDIDLSKYSRLPSLPTVAIEAVKLFHNPNSSNEALISIVRKDPAIVVRLLKAANSSRYGSRNEVTDLMRAVNMLGRAPTASLVLSFSLARQSMESSGYLEYFRQLWLRSFVQATAAEVLACQFGSPAFRGDCYTTNLLSGLGKLALLRAEPEKYVQILKIAAEKNAPLTRSEQESLGQLKRRAADLLQVSRMDALTGVCNRTFFAQRLHEQIAMHRVRGQAVALAVIDIDHFKKVNDAYGHQAGDAARKIIAETLNRIMRESDLVGRYGGEEFVIFLKDANPGELAIVGERIRSSIEAAEFSFEGQRIPMTASVGLAEGFVQGTEEEFGTRLFALADAATYRAKSSGRNCFVVESLERRAAGSHLQVLSMAISETD